MAVTSARSKFYFYNSMNCLLKALEGKRITVEIRNDIVVVGKLEFVESTMNMTMTDVVLTKAVGKSVKFSRFYVKGRQIRFVKIPDEIDIVKAMQWQLNKTEYFQAKERKQKQKIFQKRQVSRAKQAAKLDREQESSVVKQHQK